jgi:hypothetical protein
MGRRIGIGLIALVLLVACGGGGAQTASPLSGGEAAYDSAASTAAATSGGAAAPAAEQPAAGRAEEQAEAFDASGEVKQGSQNAQGGQRLVIKTATIALLVENVDAAEAQVRQLADDRDGFVLSSSAYGEDRNRTASISFKVPAERFDDAIGALAALAIKVESQEVQGQDVTDEYVDLNSRLRNLRAVETRLLQFLNDAQRTDDLLAINQQLTDVQGQIEQTQGRISYLEQSAALSTITVSLRMQPVVEVVPQAGWSPGLTARQAAKTLVAFGQGLADIAIVVGVWSPVWLPLLLIGWRLYRRSRRVPAPVTQP